MPDYEVGDSAMGLLHLVPLQCEPGEDATRPAAVQTWHSQRKWERSTPALAEGITDDATRSVLYHRERLTGGTYMVTLQGAILNWADNLVKDGMLFTRFPGDTQTYALNTAREAPTHAWRAATGLHPSGEGVAIDQRKLLPDIRIQGPVMLATPDEPGNWGLFLLQVVPAALRYVRDRQRYGKFLCHAPPGNRRDLLRLIGIRDEDFITHHVDKTYALDEVRFFQRGFRDLAVSPEDRALFLSLAENVRWDHKTRNAPKIFLSRRMRSGEAGAYRILRNELALRHALEDAGFDSIETEYMGPVDQIRAMAGAEIVVGLGGAGMFNTVFCGPGTRVLDIESTSRFTNAHTNIFSSCGLIFGVHVGKEVVDGSRLDHHDWEIDVKQVMKNVDTLSKFKAISQNTVMCRVDTMDKGRVSGWAHDPAQPGKPLQFAVYVDGVKVKPSVGGSEVEHVTCSASRPDVAAAGVGPVASGFAFMFPTSALDGLHHTFEMRTLSGGVIKMRFADVEYDQRMFGHLWTPKLLSSVEYVEGGVVSGWVLSSDPETGLYAGGQQVALTWNGRRIGSAVANVLLTEGNDPRALGIGCAFSFELPSWLLLESRPLLRVFAEPQHVEIDGSPLKLVSHDDEQRRAALGLYDTLVRLQSDLVASSTLARDIALTRYPRAAFARWDAELSALLAERVARIPERPSFIVKSARLVVFILVRDANLKAVEATLASVAAQPLPGASACLVLVNGPISEQALTTLAAKCPGLNHSVLVRRNPTVRWAELVEAMLPSGEEAWCMFAECGDALRPYAWPLISVAAARSSAAFLYFDDIDGESNPRLKPGWNRTLLHGGDLIGRSMAVRQDAVRALGKQGSEARQMAQLLTNLPDSSICHIPAILAHTTATARMIVSEGRSVDYPMLGVQADRTRVAELATAANVSILLVDEWHPGEFRRCIDLLASQLEYSSYEIAVCCDGTHFAELVAKPLALPRTVTLRHVDVGSRIDTGERLAQCLAAIKSDFVVLLSGHILRPDPRWLWNLAEACSRDAAVAAVGGKNLEVDGTIRDAGYVRTNDGGLVAVGEGQPGNAPGYLGRLTSVQEVTALAGPAIFFRKTALVGIMHVANGKASIATMLPEACLELTRRGAKVLWAPNAVATCMELSHPASPEMLVSRTLVPRIGTIGDDPFYNPSFSVEQPLFSLLRKPGDLIDSILEPLGRLDSTE